MDQYATFVHASRHRHFSGDIRGVSHLAFGNNYPLHIRQDARAIASDPEMCNFLQVQRNRWICAEAHSCTPHKRLRLTCHVFSVIDADIAEKGHLWAETNYAGTNITGQGAFSRMVMPT
jgi:hypothetical protein